MAVLDKETAPPLISIVVPLYNEEDNIAELHRRVTSSMAAIGLDHELILVNDGSSDMTGPLMAQIQSADPRVVCVHLSRNFGHQPAISAGIDQSRGQAVIVMDGDLQDPPEALDQFIRRWREGFDVVYAIREKRKEHLLKRGCYFLFYRLLRVISDIEIPLDSGDFCLMDRRVADALRYLPERMRFVRGLRTFVGFRQSGIRYERAAREAGKPKYRLRGLVRLAIDGLISFSSFPITLVSYLAFCSAGLAVLLTAYGVGGVLFSSDTPRGWASTWVIVLFMGSVQLFCLGILGEYIRRIFVETKGRPAYIVREVVYAPASAQAELDRSTDGRRAAA